CRHDAGRRDRAGPRRARTVRDPRRIPRRRGCCRGPTALSLRVDPVLYAVTDLDSGAARFEEDLGLDSIPGGPHPDWGTANRIVPLGPDYLELVCVVDRTKAEAWLFGRLVVEAGDGLVGWSVGTDDLDRVARRLGLEIV